MQGEVVMCDRADLGKVFELITDSFNFRYIYITVGCNSGRVCLGLDSGKSKT